MPKADENWQSGAQGACADLVLVVGFIEKGGDLWLGEYQELRTPARFYSPNTIPDF